MAGAATSANDMVPYRSRASIHASSADGVTAASMPPEMSPPRRPISSNVAAFGHRPRPLIVTTSREGASDRMMGATPPMLVMSGWRTLMQRPVATPASTTFPPISRMRIPAMLAR